MNRILFESLEEQYVLSVKDPRFEHVRGVLRMQEGDEFDVGILDGPFGKASLSKIEKDHMVVDVDWREQPQIPPDIWLYIGLCRPAAVGRILRTIPTLGVRGVSFFPSEKSERGYAFSKMWEKEGWRRQIIQGIEQAYSETYFPEVNLLESFNKGESFLKGCTNKVAFDLYEVQGGIRSLEVVSGRTCLLIGPERGWGPKDRKLQNEYGFQRICLSDRVMKVDTAVIAATSAFHALID